MMIYLMAMTIRLIEMHRILKPTGSIYLHCDPTASHYLKLVMDAIFEKENFRNEIVWCYRGGGVPKNDFSRKHDIILRYSKTEDVTFNIDDIRIPYSVSVMESSESRYDKSYRGNNVYSGYRPNKLGKHPEDWWTIQPLMPSDKKERTGYPTQKPLKLLERIIKASSNEGDVVLDPFCGCATACVAAEKLRRQWVGIDISPSAEAITKLRLDDASEQGALFSPIAMSDVFVAHAAPVRTDTDAEAPQQRKLPNYAVHKNDLYGQQEGDCNGCGEHFRIRNLTVDHILPQSKGGTDHPKNLQLLCQACNSTKGQGTQEQLIERLKAQGIRTA
ncbi:HNH endonuclease, partial [Candidatus Poribacteria bacterium]|nr:HNH endonuclease [Candidatus Poribacteria bacterium]